jgi:tetratricopeptide (TPR) repeat protein
MILRRQRGLLRLSRARSAGVGRFAARTCDAGAQRTQRLGRFCQSQVRTGKTTTFSKRDGKFFVRTEGPDGKPAEFEIKYTFGVAPLQQYLVELPGGRLQALTVAWDTTAKRWFSLYPRERIPAGDDLLDRPAAELEFQQQYSADRPEARTNLGGFYARIGRVDDAQSEFRAALKLDRRYVPAYVNAADVYRSDSRTCERSRLHPP